MKLYQKHKSAMLIVVTVLLLVLGASSGWAQKIVLLPMADISKGGNGVNFPLTKAVETALKQLHIELAPRSDVMLFMAKNKVRTYSYLDNYLVKILGSEFDSSLVLIGTVTEEKTATPSIGVTFTALDTADGTPVWSVTKATSIQEQVRVLGIGEPKTAVELLRPQLKELLAPLASMVHDTELSTSRDYQLLGMHLFPGYVRGGQQVEARLKIRFLGQPPTLIAAENAAGKAYLQYDRRTDTYIGNWYAPHDDGTYQVDLRMEWGREQTLEKVERVASYQVINNPPGLVMEIKKGQRVGQKLAFNRHILILPRVGDVRPMSGWALEINKSGGTQVVYQEYEGEIPERMVWEGRGADGFMLANGSYEIVLHIWDLAGNHSTVSRSVVLQASAPNVVAEISQTAGEARLNLKADGRFEFPLTSWEAELKSISGDVLVEKKGVELPAAIDFIPVEGEDHVLLTIRGEDLLGNRLNINRQKLLIVDVEQAIEEQKAESWVPDF